MRKKELLAAVKSIERSVRQVPALNQVRGQGLPGATERGEVEVLSLADARGEIRTQHPDGQPAHQSNGNAALGGAADDGQSFIERILKLRLGTCTSGIWLRGHPSTR